MALSKINPVCSFLSLYKLINNLRLSGINKNVFLLNIIRSEPICYQSRSLYMFKHNYAIKKLESCESNRSFITANDIGIIELLEKHFKCSFEEARVLYLKNYDFLQLTNDKLTERIRVLKKYGLLPKTIYENFWILVHNKDELSARMQLLQRWLFKDTNNAISILILSYMKLVKLTMQTEIDFHYIEGLNRITYFASFVQCHEKEACELFMKYEFMMTVKVEALKFILEMLRDQKVSTSDLLNDLWLFKYRPEFIAQRIKFLDKIGAKKKIKIIKPWMLRCSQLTLNRHFKLIEENTAALGSYSNMRDLLSHELGLSSAEVDEMIFRHPTLAKISYSKAKDMIDFLKAEEFDPKMIYHVPRVLCHKQATLEARIAELKKIGPFVMTLQNLCRNKKDYMAFLKKMSYS